MLSRDLRGSSLCVSVKAQRAVQPACQRVMCSYWFRGQRQALFLDVPDALSWNIYRWSQFCFIFTVLPPKLLCHFDALSVNVGDIINFHVKQILTAAPSVTVPGAV